jgi:hypothetical protein
MLSPPRRRGIAFRSYPFDTEVQMPSRIACVAVAASWWAIQGCDRSAVEPERTGPPVVSSEIVTAEVAQALTTDGVFADAAVRPGEVEGMSARDAERLATAYIRTFGYGFAGTISQLHGAPVRTDRLSICRPTYFAEPGFELEQPERAPRFIRDLVSGQFLVSLCEAGNVVAVTIGVTPSAMDHWENGQFRVPDGAGSSIVFSPIPRGSEGVPLPEVSVAEAAKASGVRVASIPRLIRGTPREGPVFVRWHQTLERNVAARIGGSDSIRAVDALSFGFDREVQRHAVLVGLLAPDANQQTRVALVDIDGNHTWFDYRAVGRGRFAFARFNPAAGGR